MKIGVKVIPGAKVDQIQTSIGNDLKIWVKGQPQEGQANRCVIQLLAKHFKVTKNQVKIIAGLKSRNKIIEIKI